MTLCSVQKLPLCLQQLFQLLEASKAVLKPSLPLIHCHRFSWSLQRKILASYWGQNINAETLLEEHFLLTFILFYHLIHLLNNVTLRWPVKSIYSSPGYKLNGDFRVPYWSSPLSGEVSLEFSKYRVCVMLNMFLERLQAYVVLRFGATNRMYNHSN